MAGRGASIGRDSAERPERSVIGGDERLSSCALTKPIGGFAVVLGAFVGPAEGPVAFAMGVGALGDGAGILTGVEALFGGTVGVVAVAGGAFTETDGAVADTVGVVTVVAPFVVEADGVVAETLGTVTVATGVLTGTVGVLRVTDGKLSEEASGTCASATKSAETRQTERAFLRNFIERAIHNS